MEITYNTEMPKKGKVGGKKKGKVRIAFEAFLKSDNKNMSLEFKEEQEATRAYYVIYACRKKEKQKDLYEVYKRGKKVYVEKTEEFFEIAKQRKERKQVCNVFYSGCSSNVRGSRNCLSYRNGELQKEISGEV